MSYKREIKWKLHLNSSPGRIYKFLTSCDGRNKYWSEDNKEDNGIINFKFINGVNYSSKILKTEKDRTFKIEYFGTIVTFHLMDDGANGTDLSLINTQVPQDEYLDMYAGWISILFALKGVADFKIDLRNHDEDRTWDELYVDN